MSSDDARNEPFYNMADWNRYVAESFRPVIRGMLLPAAIYYAITVITHYFDEPLGNFLILGTIANVTLGVFAALYARLRKVKVSFGELEIQTLVIWGLIFANITAHHLLHFEPQKLIYYVMLALIIGTIGVSMRTIIPTVLVTLVTAILLGWSAGQEVLGQFGYVALASAFVAFGISILVRGAISRAIRSRIKADELRATAEQSADHDALTGLPNRRQFFRHLEDVFADTRRSSNLVVGVIDLNGFKPVNDLYGHVFGDKLLVRVGERIARECGDDHLVARMGGDEFAILIEKPMKEAALRDLGSRISAAIGETYNIAGTEIAISTAIGFAYRVASNSVPSVLYEHADFALYNAKSVGGGAVEIFSAEDARKMSEVRLVEQQLRDSNLWSEMFVVFQPQIDIISGLTVGLEALARWRNPTLGLVSPDTFIRAAERIGIIKDVTPLLLAKALEKAADWPDPIRLSFNLSARDIMSEESVERIANIVKTSPFDSSRIDFEITETSIMTDFQRVRQSLRRLQELGVKFALDDFGVGYSNFEHIDQLNIQKLKIDRQFVTRLGQGGNTGKIVRTMIDMCANLELECVIEGVETQDELDAVHAAGGRIVQGYYFCKPLSATDALAFVKSPHRRRAITTQQLDALRA